MLVLILERNVNREADHLKQEVYGIMAESCVLDIDKLIFEFKCPHLLAVWLWQILKTSLNLSFLIYAEGVIIPISEGCWED